MSKRTQYFMGLKAGYPVILGFVSVATAYAIMAIQAGVASWQAVLMSAMVFAGSSQMIAVSLIGQGTGMLTIVLATFILNLRHFIMSTCVMNRMKKASVGMRLLAAFGVTDESFALFTTTEKEKCSVYYFLGMITVTYSSWVIGTAIGCAATQLIPLILSKGLGVTMYAMFIGLLVPNVRGDKKMGAVVLATAVLSFIFSRFFSSAWAIIFATLTGAAAGILIPDRNNPETGDME